MDKPDLNRLWHTYIKIGPSRNLTLKMIQDTIRLKICPLVLDLMNNDKINWYHFLIHPHPKDKENFYFHIRFSATSKIKKSDDLNLPSYCDLTEKVAPINNISGIDKNLLANEKIEEAWRIIGEQSEWTINMVNAHKDVGIPVECCDLL